MEVRFTICGEQGKSRITVLEYLRVGEEEKEERADALGKGQILIPAKKQGGGGEIYWRKDCLPIWKNKGGKRGEAGKNNL